MTPRVFVSHSNEDRVYAHSIARRLEEWGYSVFIDFDSRRGVVGGAAWEAEILHAIRESVAVVLCFTESVTDSLWCFGESLLARYEKKPLIPLLLHGDPEIIWGIVQQTVQHIDMRSDPEEGYTRLKRALSQLVPVNETDDVTITRDSPPYAGLAPFTESQSSFYFGRERDVRAAIGQLQPSLLPDAQRLVTITGPSGSGKSSLVAAALVPSLRRGVVPGSDEWTYLFLSPGASPSRRLAESLRSTVPDLGDTRSLTESIERDRNGLSFVLSDALALTSSTAVCLVVDQLEELVTTAASDLADRFCEGLAVSLAELSPDRLVVIATVRIDMLGQLLVRFPVSRLLLANPRILTPLDHEELATIVTGPARAVGWDVDPEVVTRLLADATSVADPLPLLSFVLRSMYDSASTPGRLSLSDYQRTGGVARALADHAEAVLADLGDELRDAVTSAIVGTLVTFTTDGSVARRRALRSDVPQEALRAFEILVTARLLVADVDASGEPTFEIAHEAIFRHWPRLRDAIDLEYADVLYARRLLQRIREDWARRRTLPTREDVNLVLASIDRLGPDGEELEVLLRWSLASGESVERLLSEMTRDVQRGEEIIDRILRNDDGKSHYGLLAHADNPQLAAVIARDQLASRLADSVVEAVRRSARRRRGQDPEAAHVEIASGAYTIGTAAAPQSVRTDGFLIAKHPVTNLEFAEYVEASGSSWPAHWSRAGGSPVAAVEPIADFPVVYVNYFDAVAYCQYLSERQSTHRLPTETEWEIAFLYGTHPSDMREFPWGDSFDSERCNTSESGLGRLTPIGYYSQFGGDSAAGIADLSGLIWEWTCSRGRQPDGAAVELSQGDDQWPRRAAEWAPRVQRGGTFLADATFARRSFRLVNLPDLALQDFGFRVVRSSSD